MGIVERGLEHRINELENECDRLQRTLDLERGTRRTAEEQRTEAVRRLRKALVGLTHVGEMALVNELDPTGDVRAVGAL